MVKTWKYYLFEVVLPVIGGMLLVAWFVFRPVFLVQVPTGSMQETIMPGDRLIATKFIFGVKDHVQRGDILVFKSEELNKLLIKRVIGLPNDEVDITAEGEVMVNGEKIEEPYVTHQSIGRVFTFYVPEGQYLFLGDNRSNSHDARYWKEKYIPKEKIEAKARMTVFPFKRFGMVK